MSEKITIKKIGRKDMPSKFKEGETYKMTTILDDKNRKMTAFGGWAEGWEVGNEVEVNVVPKTWKDRDGMEQNSLNLENPNKQPFTPRGGGGFNPTISAYQSAATFALALATAGKKKLTLEDLDKIAEHIKSKFDTTSPVSTESVPEIDVEKEEKTTAAAPKKDPDFDDDGDDEDDPF